MALYSYESPTVLYACTIWTYVSGHDAGEIFSEFHNLIVSLDTEPFKM